MTPEELLPLLLSLEGMAAAVATNGLCQECAYWPPSHQYDYQNKEAAAITTSSNASSSSTITDSEILCPLINLVETILDSSGYLLEFHWPETQGGSTLSEQESHSILGPLVCSE